ncbi:MAG: Glycosyl transferase family 2 [Candidatus Woesebacteria bacterium GW2011_GWB1_38_5b]|uniref:Glycosyl transferase family 2 n=1 Tax=Candidatus Woesebacteria bacterium GW2011_GWB1_38_5b TaxID=1618569 RepID=A0A0G0MPV8_9BACT|nr:MAG: Glycosyl transferase family 2 [Candidatus Woesebacteria bacterium GW2011_GWB1_38_5b]
MKNFLSVIVITKNEEENLSRCLSSVGGLADEVVVVDSGSTDKTLEIATRFGAKIYKRHFDNYSNQRNFAISKTTGEWVLSMDADEEISDGLALEIKQVVKSQGADGYLIPRINIIFGAEIKHSRWSPDKHIWLFRKSRGKFRNLIHEEVDVNGRVEELKGAKIHHSHKSVFEFVAMTNKYTDIEAREILKNGYNFSFMKLLYLPLRSFFGRFILKQGFRDGWRGFVLSYLRAVYQFIVWVKVWEKS